MLEEKFFKNLYQTISWFGVILVLEIPVIAGYLCSLQFGDNNGWLLLVVSAIIVFLYFSIGFYWFFQKVIISRNGIKIVFLGKTLKEYLWNDVDNIVRSSYIKNPALKIILRNSSFFYLDDRKKVRYAISAVSKIHIE